MGTDKDSWHVRTNNILCVQVPCLCLCLCLHYIPHTLSCHTLSLTISHHLFLPLLVLFLRGAIRGLLEAERAFEMLTLGAYYKYSSTAFVTFRTRMAETIAHQMLLTNDMMEISHAPNPHDG